MPHYADGKLAKHGDLVIKSEKQPGSVELLGIVVQITPGSESCNCQILPLAVRQKDSPAPWTPFVGSSLWYGTVSDCKHIECL